MSYAYWRMQRVTVLALVGAALIFSAAVAADNVESANERRDYTLFAQSEPVGRLAVVRAGQRFDVDWRIDDNGRGAKLQEQIEVDADDVPVRYSVKGKGYAGAPVEEHYEFRGGVARWKTVNDSGKARAATAPLYVGSDVTPWTLNLYTRVTARSPGATRNILPGGTLRTERLGETRIGTGAQERKIVAYALIGADAAPVFQVLDSDGWLFAQLTSFTVPSVQQTLIRDGYQGELDRLRRWTDELQTAYLARLTRALRHRFDVPIYLRNVRIFDSVAGSVGAPVTVSVFRGRIANVRAEVPPPGAMVIDGDGGTLVPGLHDMHVHIEPWGGLLSLAAGVTSVRDLGNDNEMLSKLIGHIDDGVIPGPRIVPFGFIEGRTPYSAHQGIIVDSLPRALQAVGWYADRAYPGIKIYNSFNPDWVPAVSAEAHRLGMKVTGHLPAFAQPQRMIEAGYDEIIHLNQLLLMFLMKEGEDPRSPFRVTVIGERLGTLDLHSAPVQGLFKQMRERGVAFNPTAAVFQNLLLSRPGVVAPSDAPWLSRTNSPYQRSRMKLNFSVRPDQYAAYDASWNKLLEVVRMLDESGVTILPGTDNVEGFMLHTELEAYVAAGISPARALQIATIGCARYLGTSESLGSVSPGKIADLLLVPGDPTRDISLLRKASMVMKQGEVLFPSEIHAAIGVQPFGQPPVMQKSQ
ncbi:amidohydrolase family protein [Steroidobacter sp.]|uniref:amidohydrolase family protein n=1 Tax=Steroidobacter sp. TaxID=1978227 RepID=UPI001A5C19A0|nr:amidohydrolase family protein [Steroidobacter sp.]MBL8264962.1 amidohydrolase family protein [Steroidobacter sp.]